MPLNIDGYSIRDRDVRMYERTNIVRSGLVLHLDASIFNTVTYGTTWPDLSGNGYDASFVNNPSYSDDKISFNGIDQKTDQSIPNINLSTDSLTIELWFKSNQLPTGFIDDTSPASNAALYGHRYGSDIQMFIYPESSGQSNLGVCYDDSRGNSNHRTNASIEVNEWVQFVWVARPSYQILYYVNGQLDKGPFTSADTGVSFPTNFSIARDNRYGPYSNIDMGIVRRYNRELSSTEIAHNYNVTKGRFGL